MIVSFIQVEGTRTSMQYRNRGRYDGVGIFNLYFIIGFRIIIRPRLLPILVLEG